MCLPLTAPLMMGVCKRWNQSKLKPSTATTVKILLAVSSHTIRPKKVEQNLGFSEKFSRCPPWLWWLMQLHTTLGKVLMRRCTMIPPQTRNPQCQKHTWKQMDPKSLGNTWTNSSLRRKMKKIHRMKRFLLEADTHSFNLHHLQGLFVMNNLKIWSKIRLINPNLSKLVS